MHEEAHSSLGSIYMKLQLKLDSALFVVCLLYGAPPGLITSSWQQPRTFGVPPSLPNQSMTAISSVVGQTGAPVAGASKIDPIQIPRPIPSSSVILHETRQGNQANRPPVIF